MNIFDRFVLVYVPFLIRILFLCWIYPGQSQADAARKIAAAPVRYLSNQSRNSGSRAIFSSARHTAPVSASGAESVSSAPVKPVCGYYCNLLQITSPGIAAVIRNNVPDWLAVGKEIALLLPPVSSYISLLLFVRIQAKTINPASCIIEDTDFPVRHDRFFYIHEIPNAHKNQSQAGFAHSLSVRLRNTL